jgi:PHD/YefM family antitoxin component YafN of YafNO toxin-antitoxin module
MKEKVVSVREGKQNFTQLLKEIGSSPIIISNEKEKKVVGVIISGEDFKEYNLLKAYYKALKLSDELSSLDITALELSTISREELEKDG